MSIRQPRLLTPSWPIGEITAFDDGHIRDAAAPHQAVTNRSWISVDGQHEKPGVRALR